MGMYGNVWDREFNHFSGMIWAMNLKISHAFCSLKGVWNMLRRPAGRPLHFRHNSGSAPKVDCCLEWTCVKCSWTWVLTQNLQQVAAIIFISNYNHQQINRWLSLCNHIISQSIAFTSHGDDSPASWKMLEKPAISESAGGLFASSSNHSRKGLKGRLFKLGAPLSLWNPRRNAKSPSWVCKANGQNSSAFIAITNSPYTKWYWYISIYISWNSKINKNTGYEKNTRFSTKTRCFQDPELHQAAHAPFGDPLQEWPSRSLARCSPWPLGDAMVTPTCSPYILFTHWPQIIGANR